MDAWGYIVAVGVGAMIGAGATIITTAIQSRGERKERQKDREEHYKQMLYPTLLDVSNEAYFLLLELARAVPGSIKDWKEERVKAIVEAQCELDKWWRKHRFYLGEESQSGILEAIALADFMVDDYAMPDDSDAEGIEDKRIQCPMDRIEFGKCIRNTVIALENGVGMKHIEIPVKDKQEGKS